MVDKMRDLGYSIDTKGAASRSAPQMCHEEIIVTLERVGRLSLLVIVILADQGNDGNDDHAELKNSFPCNHNRHPLSIWKGAKEELPPNGSRGTACRGAGSTSGMVAQNSTNCKENGT